MDQGLKERLVGAAVLVAIAVWLIPWVLDGPEDGADTQASTDRGATGEELATLLESLGAAGVHIAADVAAACAAARAAAEPADRVVVYGSFHTVGAALEALRLYCAPSPMVDRRSTWTRD